MNRYPSPSSTERRCAICRVSLGDEVLLPYCRVHLAEYEKRNTLGVDADQLEGRWGDTLGRWRGRPPALADEVDVDLFRFRQRVGAWLLFRRGYAGRFPDWIAVNVATSEVVRLVDVGVHEALDHFEGIRPAPYQGALSSRWGTRDPRNRLNRHRSLADRVASAEFPVYGLLRQPLGLRLHSVQHSISGRRTTGMTLVFAGPAPMALDVVASFGSYVSHRGVVLPKDDDEEAIIGDAMRVLRERDPRLVTRISLASPERLDRHVEIPEFAGESRLVRFPGSDNIFHLSSKDSHFGFTFVFCGISEDGLSGLLRNLAVVNGRDDLLEQYQAELDETRGRRA